MELTTAQQIILIILASVLAILLVLAIVVMIMVARLLKTLRLIAKEAEKFIESAEAVGDVFKRAAGPLGLLRFIQAIVEAVSQHNRGKDKKGK